MWNWRPGINIKENIGRGTHDVEWDWRPIGNILVTVRRWTTNRVARTVLTQKICCYIKCVSYIYVYIYIYMYIYICIYI